jgi:hypothetical protein
VRGAKWRSSNRKILKFISTRFPSLFLPNHRRAPYEGPRVNHTLIRDRIV